MPQAYRYVPLINCKDVLLVPRGPEYPNRVLCTTNGVVRRDGCAVMGKGVALGFKKRYPGIDRQLGALIKEYGSRVQLIQDRIYAFPTKHRWQDDADVDLIRTSCRQLAALVEEDCKDGRWFLSTPGCLNGGLGFDKVLRVLLEEFDRPWASRVVIVEKSWERYQLLAEDFNFLVRGQPRQDGRLPPEFNEVPF